MSVATVPIQSASPDREPVACYYCGSLFCSPFETAQDDLTGRPGNFTFVTCKACGLVFQNPRIGLQGIKTYYDDEYIAHRKKADWGILTRFFDATMDRLDRKKDAIARHYVSLTRDSEVLDAR